MAVSFLLVAATSLVDVDLILDDVIHRVHSEILNDPSQILNIIRCCVGLTAAE